MQNHTQNIGKQPPSANELSQSFVQAEITACGSNSTQSPDVRKAAAAIISGGMGLGAIEIAGGAAAADLLAYAGPEIACLGALGVMAVKYVRPQL